MEVDELKKALLSKRPVMVKHILLGDIFQSEMNAIIYEREKDEIKVGVRTRDAFVNSVTMVDPKNVRYATAEEIRDFYIKRKNSKHIKPNLYYKTARKESIYKLISRMSLIEIAKLILILIDKDKTLPFCKVGLCQEIDENGLCNKNKDYCFKAILNWLESEAV